AGLEVEELAEDVRVGDVQVVRALPRGQLVVQLASLGVDEVRGERSSVAAEQRVRQRAVAPEEPREVEADQERRERVDQPDDRLRTQRAGEHRAVGQRVDRKSTRLN